MTEQAFRDRAAVLGASGRVFVPGRGLESGLPAGHLGDVARWVRAGVRADVLLCTKAGRAHLGDVAAAAAAAAADGWEVWPDPGAAPGPQWRYALRSAGCGWVRLVFLDLDRDRVSGPWAGASSEDQLVLGLSRFAHTTGQAWRDSSGKTAQAIILGAHPRSRGGVTLDVAPVQVAPAADPGMEQALNWRRRLTAAERDGGFVHSFDQNSAYLSAWGAVELGFGDPQHHELGCTFDPKVAGLWRLRWLKTAAEARAERAALSLPMPYGEGSEWVTTPTMVRLVELSGRAPAVCEAWTWPRRSRFLRGAAEVLRDARAQLLTEPGEGPALALAAVKDIYRRQTGRFEAERAEGDGSGWRRPDWALFIRAQARVNLHRRVCRLVGAAPFAIATDELVFATDDPDPAGFAASIGLPVGSGLGAFKVKATRPLSLELLEQLEAGGVGAVFKAIHGRRLAAAS